MSTNALPGVVWVVLILALIPGVQGVLERFFPSAEYWYSALIVAVLGAIAKAIEVWARQQGMQIEVSDGAPTPLAALAASEVAPPGKLWRWLFG
jgi:hypothetical protein